MGRLFVGHIATTATTAAISLPTLLVLTLFEQGQLSLQSHDLLLLPGHRIIEGRYRILMEGKLALHLYQLRHYHGQHFINIRQICYLQHTDCIH